MNIHPAIEKIWAYLREVDQNSWRKYIADPLPGWACRSTTLFEVENAHLGENLEPADLIVCSIPFDATASTRNGARYGPGAIRNASLAYSFQTKLPDSEPLYHTRLGRFCHRKILTMRDLGDLHVYPSNPERQMEATIAEIYRLALDTPQIIILGGEHTISFATYSGIALASQRQYQKTTGYVQIDHHFDFGHESALHGCFFHGSNARRISEYPLVDSVAMGLVGMGDITSKTRFEEIANQNIPVKTILDIRRDGFEKCLREVLDKVAGRADQIYVSVDIDVCDNAVAPGTGNVTIGGLDLFDFLSIAGILKEYPVCALDVVEVSPRGEGDTTAHIAAKLLFEYIFLEDL